MRAEIRLETPRLVLRRRRLSDFPAVFALWSDPVTMTHFGTGPMGREDVFTAFARAEGMWDLQGFSLWLVEERATGAFVGEVGPFDRKRDLAVSIDGKLELGWAIDKAHYGKGYAREALAAALAWADAHCPHEEHIAIIAPTNEPSKRVAEAVGFRLAGEMDFKGRPTLAYLRRRGDPIPQQLR